MSSPMTALLPYAAAMREAEAEYRAWNASTTAAHVAASRTRGAGVAARNKEIIKRFRAGETQAALARAYGLTSARIAQITRNARRRLPSDRLDVGIAP